MRICRKCGLEKPASEFEIYNKEKGWRRWECKVCVSARVKAWNDKSRAKIQEYKRQWHEDNRDEVIARATQWAKDNPDRRRQISLAHYYRLQHEAIVAYGGYKCACCGENQPLFLSIDHVASDGAKHRKEIGSLGGAKFYRWLRDRRYPKGFQVLCMNCNHGRHRNGGICPHKDKV